MNTPQSLNEKLKAASGADEYGDTIIGLDEAKAIFQQEVEALVVELGAMQGPVSHEGIILEDCLDRDEVVALIRTRLGGDSK